MSTEIAHTRQHVLACRDIDPAAEQASLSVLRNAARGRSTSDIPRVDAIRELSTRSSTDSTTELLVGLAENAHEDPTTRFEAALSLGRQINASSRGSLARLVSGSDVTVAVGAARALRSAGDESSLRALARIEGRPGTSPTLLREVGATATIISHRLRSEQRTFRVPPGSQLIEPPPGRGESIGLRSLGRSRLLSAIEHARLGQLAVKPSEAGGASELKCQGRDLLIVPSEHLDGTSMAELLAQPSIPAIVFTGANLSLETYQASGYILAKPGRGRQLDLAAQNGRGRIWLAGTARVRSDRQLDFELSGVRTKNSAAVKISGSFDLGDGTITLDDARSETRFDRSRRPAGTPTRATG